MKRLKSNKGMTMVEVVIALAILGLVAVGIMGFFTDSFKFQARSQNLVVAQKDAEDIMEELKKNNGYYEEVQIVDPELKISNDNAEYYEELWEDEYILSVDWEKSVSTNGLVDNDKTVNGDIYVVTISLINKKDNSVTSNVTSTIRILGDGTSVTQNKVVIPVTSENGSITYKAGAATGVINGYGVIKAEEGTQIELIATPNDGYKFNNWSYEGTTPDYESGNELKFKAAENSKIIADFEVNTDLQEEFSITVVEPIGGTIEYNINDKNGVRNGELDSSSVIKVAKGGTIQFSAEPKEDYAFDSWKITANKNSKIYYDDELKIENIKNSYEVRAKFGKEEKNEEPGEQEEICITVDRIKGGKIEYKVIDIESGSIVEKGTITKDGLTKEDGNYFAENKIYVEKGNNIEFKAINTEDKYTFNSWETETVKIESTEYTIENVQKEQTIKPNFDEPVCITIPENVEGGMIAYIETDPITGYVVQAGQITKDGIIKADGTKGEGNKLYVRKGGNIEFKAVASEKYQFTNWKIGKVIVNTKICEMENVQESFDLSVRFDKDPEFTATKESIKPVVGEKITYYITVKNVGEKTEKVEVTDDLTGKPLENIANISNGGKLENNVITWNLIVEAGKSVQVHFDATVSSDIKVGETIENTAKLKVRGKNFETNTLVGSVENKSKVEAVKRDAVMQNINIALAIDLSGSMTGNMGNTSRLQAAKDAAIMFVENLYENADEGQNITVTLFGFNRKVGITKYYTNEICPDVDGHEHGNGCAIIDGTPRKECTDTTPEHNKHILSDTCYPFNEDPADENRIKGAEVIIFTDEDGLHRTATKDNYKVLNEKILKIKNSTETYLVPALQKIDQEFYRLEKINPGKNIVIILADGECYESNDTLTEVSNSIKETHDAKFYSIAFGPDVNNPTGSSYKKLQALLDFKVGSEKEKEPVYAAVNLEELIGVFTEIIQSVNDRDNMQSENGKIRVEMKTANPYPIEIKYNDPNGKPQGVVIREESQLEENHITIVDNLLTWDISGDNYYKCTNLVVTYNQELETSEVEE